MRTYKLENLSCAHCAASIEQALEGLECVQSARLQFATLDLLSGGRAEIMAGRGSFIESFPLFGYDLDDYEELFVEKLDLLLALRSQGEHVTWAGSGKFRAPLTGQSIQPRPIQDPLPVTIARPRSLLSNPKASKALG